MPPKRGCFFGARDRAFQRFVVAESFCLRVFRSFPFGGARALSPRPVNRYAVYSPSFLTVPMLISAASIGVRPYQSSCSMMNHSAPASMPASTTAFTS